MSWAYTRPRYQVSVYRTTGPLDLLVTETIDFLSLPQEQGKTNGEPAEARTRAHSAERPS